jgi:2-polyprenyl-3-methyl-5-hydroxy-6-metoxy-1,4-benzoquinol methylase
MEQLKDFFHDKNVKSILDVGTGTGDFLKVLTEDFPSAAIVGVDPDSKSLEEAAKKFPEITFQKMGAEKLLFKANSFDVVSISMALHHLPKIQKSLKEIKRVVKPGGWIIVNELFSDNLNPAQEVQKMFHHFRSRVDRILGICHRETFKKAEIIQMVKDAGIPIQFYFEHTPNVNMIENKTDLEMWVEKIKQNLERISGLPDYEILKPKIIEFRENAAAHGFQPATRVVIVGKK